MFKNPRRGRQARNFTINVPKILDLKSSSEQIFSRKLTLGAPDYYKVGDQARVEVEGIEEQMLIFSSSLTPGRVKGS